MTRSNPHAGRPARAELASRDHIDLLVRRFYERALADPVLAPVFDVLAVVGLDDHLVVVGDFWEQILFRTTRYRGAFVPVHRALHGHHGLTPARFERWLQLWCETVDETFHGVDADRAKAKAGAMVTSLQKSLYGGTTR
ncbi:group III truncated hemoglobin [Rhodococcus sp. R1101]|uniref:group III truncated hemoglobin n=1 Tax=Rhodococcus sp. R1101 TaxID=1170698 RepID=UPI0003151BC2|nr:group III truncated hemoglobin [Rhodococcus sp. R1101]